jgi:hypothetical protein
VPRDNQNYQPRDAQPQEPRQQEPRHQDARPHERPQPRVQNEGVHEALPAFITGGAPQPGPQPPNGQNGYENQGDRFPLHRRRRRHRGPRNDMGGAPQGGNQPDDGGA